MTIREGSATDLAAWLRRYIERITERLTREARERPANTVEIIDDTRHVTEKGKKMGYLQKFKATRNWDQSLRARAELSAIPDFDGYAKWKFQGLQIEILPFQDDTFELIITPVEDPPGLDLAALEREIDLRFPPVGGAAAGEAARESTDEPRGPILATEIRAEVIKGIKDEHPEWPYWKVALEAQAELDDPNISAETVRNVYRSMGWEWERGKRLR